MILTEQRVYWLFIAVVFFYLLHLLSPILGPFLFSALLAYLGDPVVDRLEKHMSRTLSVSVVFVTILLVLGLTILVFIPLVSEQLSVLLKKVPGILAFVQNKMVPLLENYFHYQLGTENSSISALLQKSLDDLPSLLNKLLIWLNSSSGFVVAFFTNIFLIPVVTFYLLRDWDILVAKVRALLPRQQAPKIAQIAKESNDMLSAFLRGQFAVMNALAVIYAVGLSVVGLDSAIFIGFVAGWLSFVPYLGLVIGIGVASLMAYFQFHDFTHSLGVIVVFVLAQVIEGSVLTPRLVGERIGLHPVAVIFAILAGGQLAGFSGILLALPVAAVLNVLISHIQVVYQKSKLYNDDSDKKKEESQ